MKNLEGVVELAGSAFYNMLRSVIENLEPDIKDSKEVIGDLLGKRIKYSFICVNAYPLTTSLNKPSKVFFYEENLARTRELNRVTNNRGGLGTLLIGDYHSHIYSDDENRTELSNQDIEDAGREIKNNNRTYWLKIVLGLRRRKYKTPKEHGEYLTEYPRKLRVILRARFKPDELPDAPKYRGNTLNAYDIIISAYLLEKKNEKIRIRELKVRKRKIKIRSI